MRHLTWKAEFRDIYRFSISIFRLLPKRALWAHNEPSAPPNYRLCQMTLLSLKMLLLAHFKFSHASMPCAFIFIIITIEKFLSASQAHARWCHNFAAFREADNTGALLTFPLSSFCLSPLTPPFRQIMFIKLPIIPRLPAPTSKRHEFLSARAHSRNCWFRPRAMLTQYRGIDNRIMECF